MNTDLLRWKKELSDELTGDILPFWINFLGDGKPLCGRIDGHGVPHPEAGISAILLSRMLWAFSAIFRTTRLKRALDAARKVHTVLAGDLIDPVCGGVFWEIAPDGNPLETKKQSYALGFAIYGLSEYARATGDADALAEARALFETLEKEVWDPRADGYVEALSRDWKPLQDMRLSDKDANTYFSMNSHLHLLEPYTNLLRIWPDARLREAVLRLIRIHTEHLFDERTGHLNLFFDPSWKAASQTVSYGHDIEASWLLDEAAEVARDASERVRTVSSTLAEKSLEGLLPDGSLAYEFDPLTGTTDTERHWWVQAEGIVGFFNHYEKCGDERFLQAALGLWQYIRTHLLDKEGGEWFWSIRPDGSVNRDDDKAGFWKCPYHNSRMCMEIISRIEKLTADKA